LKLLAVVQHTLHNRLETFWAQLTMNPHAELNRQSTHRTL